MTAPSTTVFRWWKFGIASVICSSALVSLPALALQGIGISPTSQEVNLSGGGVQTGSLTVINDGSNDVTYKVYATDYTVKNEAYQGVFSTTDKDAQISPVSWFTVPSGTFVVKSREEATLPYKITAPKNAAVGGHYGSVFVETVPPKATGATLISRVERVASLFYIGIDGDVTKKGAVLPLEVPWLEASSPIHGDLRVQNTGNIHFAVDVTAKLSSPFGSVGSPQNVHGEVLPGTTRKIPLRLNAPSPIGFYKVSVQTSYLGQTDNKSHWVFLVPKLTLIIAGLTVLLLITVAIIAKLRKRRS